MTDLSKRRVSPATAALVRRLYEEGARNYASLRLRLYESVASGHLERGDVPGDQTLRRMVKDLEGSHYSEAASLADYPTTSVRSLLNILASVVVFTKGGVTGLSKAEIQWIERVQAAAEPGLPDMAIYFLAREYMYYEREGISPGDLDLLLAFSPWQSAPLGDFYISQLRRMDRTPPLPEIRATAHQWGRERLTESAGYGSLMGVVGLMWLAYDDLTHNDQVEQAGSGEETPDE